MTEPAAKPFLSTMSFPDDQRWNDHVRVLRPPAGTHRRWLRDFLRESRGRRAVIVRGTVGLGDRYRDLLGAALLRWPPDRPRVVVSDATIEPGSEAVGSRLPAPLKPLGRVLPLASRALIHAVDGPHVTWCVLSTRELETFPTTWHVPAERVVFTPFTHTLWGGGEHGTVTAGDYLFSGGNSLRDYDLLEEAVTGLDVPVRIAARWRPRGSDPRLTAAPVTHEEFGSLMRGCRALVLPLRESTRSTGQQTYLNAMALGKVVIVTDAPGVRDHIEDGVTGMVVPPTAAALRAAVADLLDPRRAGHHARMGRRARETVLARFTGDDYRAELLRLAARN